MFTKLDKGQLSFKPFTSRVNHRFCRTSPFDFRAPSSRIYVAHKAKKTCDINRAFFTKICWTFPTSVRLESQMLSESVKLRYDAFRQLRKSKSPKIKVKFPLYRKNRKIISQFRNRKKSTKIRSRPE